MADILLSIHPEYVARIFGDGDTPGDKYYEFRKRLPAQTVERAVVYSSSPVCRIVGEFTVSEVLTDGPAALWTRTHESAGITVAKFNRYFYGRSTAHALAIGTVTRYAEPIDPWSVGPYFAPPQSFTYLDSISIDIRRAIKAARG